MFSQNYSSKDSIVLSYPSKFKSPEKLAQQISSDFKSDYDKLRAVFTWITHNIIYDPDEYNKFNFSYINAADYAQKQNRYEKRLSNRVIHKGKAVCEGYAVLFKTICDQLKIKSRVITGFAKSEVNDIGKRHNSNHAWNMVTINNNKFLIDATWGAGTYNGRFEKNPNFFYFMTDPNEFILDHYPDQYENALLENEIDKLTFSNSPIYYQHDVKLLSPNSGIIHKNEIGVINFKLKTRKKVSSISYNLDNKSYKITEFSNTELLTFQIDLTEAKSHRKLILFMDHQAVMAFKLK